MFLRPLVFKCSLRWKLFPVDPRVSLSKWAGRGGPPYTFTELILIGLYLPPVPTHHPLQGLFLVASHWSAVLSLSSRLW